MQPWQTTFLGNQALPRTLTPFELRYFFSFTEVEMQAIRSRRRHLNQLGAALHLGFIKMSGRALDAFDMVPRLLLAHLWQELEIPVPRLTSLRALYRRRRTLYEHQRWATDVLGFRNLTERQLRVLTGLIKKESYKALTRAQMITFARCWCYEHKLLIPGDRALDDLVRKSTQQAEHDLLDEIKEAIPESVRQDWLLALGSNHSKDRSVLEWLQGDPGKPSRATLNRQLAYIDYLKGISVHEYPLDMLRLEHQRQLAQRIRRRRPARWQTLKEPRRTLESVCFLRVTLLQKTDELISMIERETLKLRRDTIEQVKSAHAKMGVSLREKIQDLHTYAQAPGRTLPEVRQAIAELQPDANIPRFTSQAGEVRYHMTDSAHRVRRLLRALLSLEFEGPRGHLLIAAISSLRVLYDKRARHLPPSVDGTFSPIWSAIIEGPDRARALRGFETAILFELKKALRNGSVWVPHSMSHRHREQLLIPSRQWRQGKKRYYTHLNLPADPERYVARYKKRLDEGLEQVAEAVLSNHIDIEKDQLVTEALEADAVSPELEPTRDAIFGEIGAVQFPELMMEVDSHTRFSSALLGHEPSSWEELLAVYAALLAHGTDMSPTGMALMIPQISTPAISDRMALLENSAALRLANDSCVAFTLRHPITRTWGEGTMASADSMSLDATRHLFSARQDPRRGRKAIGIYTHKLDQWPLIYDQPIVLMRRQSGAAIEGMLRQRTGEALERIAVDTHGFTFFGMGLSKGLGFDLCPRLRGIKRQLHVPRGTRVPDILEPVVTRDVSMVNIRAGWDGFVRLMASVDEGTLSAVLALDRFGSESRADPIHKCGSAMGQLFLTLFLCDFVGKDEFRRELLRILDRGESTHRLLRAIYAGNIPAHRGRRPEELIAISGSLTLLSNITIAWMTLHMQQVINRWKKEEGRHVDPELLRHIGPARSEGVNFRGKLDFPVRQYQDRLLSRKARNLGQADL